MDTQRSPLLSWAYFCQGKSMEDLRQSLLYTSLELETTRLQAQEEVRKRDELLAHLKDVLNKAIKERDEATEKCQKLFLENLILQQQQQQQQQQFQQQQAGPLSGVSSIDDEPRRGIDSNNGFSNSDCEESIVSSPVIDPFPQPPPPQPQLPHSQPQHHHQQQQPQQPQQPQQQPQPQPQPQPSPPIVEERMQQLVTEKPLPEKGKFLQAVMKAGPLLQTLLLAGPLPQWRHPPPPLESFEIPPVTIPSPPPSLLQHQDSISLIINNNNNNNNNNNCSRVNNRKRGLCEGSDSSTESKYQRVLLH